MTITYNSNELRSGRPQLLKKRGLDVERDKEGYPWDYTVNGVPTEVKEGLDYIESIENYLLNDQCWEMSASSKESWVVLIGTPSLLQNLIHKLNQDVSKKIVGIRGLREIVISSNIGIMRRKSDTGAQGTVYFYAVENREDFVTFMRKLDERTQDPEGTIRRLKLIRRHFKDSEVMTQMLCAIPLIDETIAHRLLEEIGNILEIANANPHQLIEVKGIGKKRAWEIFRFFRMTRQATLERETIEDYKIPAIV